MSPSLHFPHSGARVSDAREIVTYVLNFATGQTLSYSRWSKSRVELKRNKDDAVVRLSVKELADRAAALRDFDLQRDGLEGALASPLSDHLAIAHTFPYGVDPHTGSVFEFRIVSRWGQDFPLNPRIDREGAAWTSMEDVIVDGLVDDVYAVVEAGEDLGKGGVEAARWLRRLRAVIIDVISAIDIALNELYLLALYRPKPGWRADQARLGQRHNRRLEDKLGWVYTITGRHLDEKEASGAVHELRELRNHLTHFDPPCFVCTYDDAAHWLNLVRCSARMLWAIKRCEGEPLNRPLIRWLLIPEVRVRSSTARAPRSDSAGYSSTRWSAPVER